VSLLVRGSALEKSMSQYLIDQLATKSNIAWNLERDPYLLETSVPGIFACGDVRYRSIKRVAAAVGEGSMAIAFVHQFLQAGNT
jgi:thioredoxin reductase